MQVISLRKKRIEKQYAEFYGNDNNKMLARKVWFCSDVIIKKKLKSG